LTGHAGYCAGVRNTPARSQDPWMPSLLLPFLASKSAKMFRQAFAGTGGTVNFIPQQSAKGRVACVGVRAELMGDKFDGLDGSGETIMQYRLMVGQAISALIYGFQLGCDLAAFDFRVGEGALQGGSP